MAGYHLVILQQSVKWFRNQLDLPWHALYSQTEDQGTHSLPCRSPRLKAVWSVHHTVKCLGHRTLPIYTFWLKKEASTGSSLSSSGLHLPECLGALPRAEDILVLLLFMKIEFLKCACYNPGRLKTVVYFLKGINHAAMSRAGLKKKKAHILEVHHYQH